MSESSSNVSCPDFSAPYFDSNGNLAFNNLSNTSSPYNFPSVQPNPDISGSGVTLPFPFLLWSEFVPWIEAKPGHLVLIGFTASAYLTLLLVLIHYVMGCVQEEDLNILDQKFLRTIRRMAHFAPSPEWKEPLGDAVLMFSDQQIVTGIALLASGYSQLPKGLDAYHWQLLVYLAWFSSFTHLTTLTVLRNYFQKHPATRLWRIVLMIVTVSLLAIALLPTGNQWWLSKTKFPDTLGVPALCFYQARNLKKQAFGMAFPGSVALALGMSSDEQVTQPPSMIISILVLFFGYVARMVKLWPEASGFTKTWLRTKPGNAIKTALRASNHRSRQPKANIYWKLQRMVFEVIYIVTLAHLVIWESMLWEILWLLFALGWGTAHLFGARSLYGGNAQSTPTEDSWSFGQFLPVVLLTLPILSMAENCYETWRNKHVHNSESHGSVNHTDDNTINNHLQGPSTHGHQVGAHQQRSQLISIGTWPSGTSTGLAVGPIEVQKHHAIARTGTTLSGEEWEVETSPYEHELSSNGSMPPSGVADTRSSDADATSPHDPLPAHKTSSDSRSEEVYRLAWFSALVVTLLLLICEVIIFLLINQAFMSIGSYNIFQGLAFPGLAFYTAMAYIGFLSVVVLYTGIFVFLTEYHNAVGKFLDRFLFLHRSVQPMCLRVVAYSYCVCCIGLLAVFLWIFLLSNY